MARLPPLNWLRAFEASARALSFTEAAQELHMTQSAVSQQIKSLEHALGRTLFHRRARGLELTDIGRGYLPTVQAAFSTLEEGTAVLTGRSDPDVLELHSNISFAIFWLTPRLQRFLDEFPWVQLDVATSIWPTEKPRNLAAVEIVLGLGKWEGRAGQRLTRDQVFPVCTPEVAARIHDVSDLLKENLFELPGTLQTWDNWLAGPLGQRKVERPRTHLVSTWAFNVDALRLSCYLQKDRGARFSFGPVWDFDRALSSTDSRDADPLVWRSVVGDRGTDFFNFSWWNRLFKDPNFYQRYICLLYTSPSPRD